MNCVRCDGLLLESWDGEVGTFLKCINCGGCMPRFTSPEAKEKWLASTRATRAAKKAGQAEGRAIVRESTPRGSGINGVIEEIDSKIAALENLKKQLRHAQELVNL